MKIAVLNNMAPFVYGGAEELATHLVDRLGRRGHDVELIRVPFRWEPFDVLPGQMAIASALRLDRADRVIALKFPAYQAPHEDKTLWLLHQFRQAYDLRDSPYSTIPRSPEGDSVVDAIKREDARAFRDSRQIFTNSATTKARLAEFNGVHAEVLHPPLNDPDLFHNEADEPYLFAGGRVNSMKRQELLVRALAKTPTDVRLVIAGPPEGEDIAPALQRLAEELDVADRLTLDIRFLAREEIAQLVNRSRACLYIPFEEDSLGYVSMEAAQASKPVITTTDSGGILGLVGDGYSGWVAEPTAEALAEAMTDAFRRPAQSRNRGRNMNAHWEAHGATWDKTLDRLLR